ncbi:hypothetical protein DN051_04335 [Streptomyces cadmiisoli]|uniref:Uncharacterized protein n=1 Tax=Streptomyces cadmiisoli TaxID=2184053 RepID=A0A2Z4ITA8_9ACTN|nr:hypothetical protein DN051_04335 [Streptomyces cadmiisoli]
MLVGVGAGAVPGRSGPDAVQLLWLLCFWPSAIRSRFQVWTSCRWSLRTMTIHLPSIQRK